MVGIATCTRNIFRVVEQIQFAVIQNQARGYFVLLVIRNVIYPLPIPLTSSYLTQLFDCRGPPKT